MGLFADTFAALFALEDQVVDQFPGLQRFDWQPRRRPNGDALWNWIVPDGGEAEWPDFSRHRDVIVIRATIAVKESADDQGQVGRLRDYIDGFVNVIDPALHSANSAPWLTFPGCGVQAWRTGMNTALYPYSPNDPPLLAVDFPIRLQLDRNTFT